ncbi:putative Alpha-glucan water dikinase 2 [Cocos nucifera]|uniref:Putative Alpha-glucan water dikinase 2 n=1 Tax=Cocos nucifera TaxID=13894 RepID=A0A8K0N5T2_COCNU|nr:putative Alpha-glucan water dikinase 2 [Cocos nucifera]
MSSLSSANRRQAPVVHRFELGEGVQLQVNVSRTLNGCSIIDIQLINCSSSLILHWGCVYSGQTNWLLPDNYPMGTKIYKRSALQTPFSKRGDNYLITIELRDPKFDAIEFVLKDERHHRWFQSNQGNFRIDIPKVKACDSPSSIPKDLVEQKAYLIWESRGRPKSSLQEKKADYDSAFEEIQRQLSKGLSLNEIRSSLCLKERPVKRAFDYKETPMASKDSLSSFYHERHDVCQWLTKKSLHNNESASFHPSTFLNLVEKTMGGGDNANLRQSYNLGSNELVVLLKSVRGECHIILAVNLKGATVLHWGVSKMSAGEWLFVDINLKGRNLMGVQFVLWSGGFWLKNNDSNFYISLKSVKPTSGKGEGYGTKICKWLLDEISEREKDAERSLMHREISAAQDKFTDLLERMYTEQQDDREILRLFLATVGRGGQGDVGQRIRDEILILQALLGYAKSNFDINIYWRTLNANGLTKHILASYDRPIVSDPQFHAEAKEGLIRDLEAYLKTLKAVHSGADLESAIATCLGHTGKGYDSMNVRKSYCADCLSPKLQKLLESRIELRPILFGAKGRLKDFIYLDLALDSAVKTSIEKSFTELSNVHLQDWYRACDSYKPHDRQWSLHTKAVLDHIQLTLADKAQYYLKMIQPSAEYLGKLLRVESWAVINFTEELIRAGSGATLSILVNRLNPIIRNMANLGSWQVISPVEVCGFIDCVNKLIDVQSKVFNRPTIIISNRVTGEEEIPDGVVGVLTSDMPDVLSHVSIRARNNKVCFASCFDQNILQDLQLKKGMKISVRPTPSGLAYRQAALSIAASFPETLLFFDV